MRKPYRLLSIPAVLYVIFLFSTPSAGCSKTTTVHDTTVRVVTDTLTDTVTVTVRDTVNICNCNLTDGLVAYYNFNGGNLNDSSGYNNNIFASAATKTADRFGNPNNAYLFNGTGSFMQIHNSVSLNPDSITMFAIIKVNGFYTGTCFGNYILSKGSVATANGYYALAYADIPAGCNTPDLNKESFGASFGDNNPVGSGNQAGSDTAFIKTGLWYFVTFTYDGKTAKLYVNGQLKDSRNSTTPFHANADDLFIGRLQADNFPYYVNGVIDEVRIYNRALCATAVMQLNNLKE